MNIFSNLKIYNSKYSISKIEKFTDEEKSVVMKAEVVPSKYGRSACFFFKNGTTAFIPMAEEAKSQVGDVIDMDTAEILYLSRPGDPTIMRIRG